MAPYAFAITKKVTWRGAVELFSNVYRYDGSPGGDDVNDILDTLKAAEVLVHSPDVTFVQGRAWGPTNQGPAASETLLIKDFSGTGQLVPSGGKVYKELAVVVNFYLGRSPTTGRKRILRKYIHSCARPSSGATAGGDDLLTTADKQPFLDFANDVKNIQTGTEEWNLCAPDGDHLPLGTVPTILDRMHIRQFKQ